jgi:hypothetical protein
MNAEPNASATKTCPHIAPKTRYVAIFSGVTVKADVAVQSGNFVFKTARDKDDSKAINIGFAAAGGSASWSAPGSIVREDVVGDSGGAFAVIQFGGKDNSRGCKSRAADGSNTEVNCGISGTLTIRVLEPQQ